MPAGQRRRAAAAGCIALFAAFVLVSATPLPRPAPTRPAAGAPPAAEALEIVARPLGGFRIVGFGATRFGGLEWAGGFELSDRARRIGGLSSLVVSDAGGRLTALSDDGVQVVAEIRRDAAGDPVTIAAGAARPLVVAGERAKRKSDLDAEGFDVAIEDGRRVAYVAFEGVDRIGRAAIGRDGFVGPLERLRLPEDMRGFRVNKGLEALAVAPRGTPLAGGFVVIAEAPRRGEEAAPGWARRADGRWRRFSVVHRDGYDITDAAFLPGGDLLVLERLFGFPGGIGMRIRRIAGADLAAAVAREGAAPLDGATLIEAGLADQIDNMEGLSVWTDPAGAVRLAIVSDDNRALLQRTLYLEFRVVE